MSDWKKLHLARFIIQELPLSFKNQSKLTKVLRFCMQSARLKEVLIHGWELRGISTLRSCFEFWLEVSIAVMIICILFSHLKYLTKLEFPQTLVWQPAAFGYKSNICFAAVGLCLCASIQQNS